MIEPVTAPRDPHAERAASASARGLLEFLRLAFLGHPDQLLVARLIWVEGVSQRHAADHLGWTRERVRHLLTRARARLRAVAADPLAERISLAVGLRLQPNLHELLRHSRSVGS